MMNDRPSSGKVSRCADLVATVVIGVLQLVSSLVLSAVGWFQLMSVASCSETECDYTLLGVSGYLTAIIATLAFSGTLVFVVLRAVRGRTTWWITCIGLGMVIVGYAVATLLNQVARA